MLSQQPPKIVVIIPAYNETSVLVEVIDSLLVHHYEIVVVDDGSEPPLAPMIASKPIHLLRHRANLGQGAALQTGIAFARTLHPDYLISFDADGQHDASSIPLLIEPLANGKADISMGSRFLLPEKTAVPFSKKILLQVARAINFLFSGLWLSDAHNGLRAMNATALRQINITENRMAHASEILFEIKKAKLRLVEVPVQIRYTDYSRKKGQSGWNSIRIVFDLLLHKLFK